MAELHLPLRKNRTNECITHCWDEGGALQTISAAHKTPRLKSIYALCLLKFVVKLYISLMCLTTHHPVPHETNHIPERTIICNRSNKREINIEGIIIKLTSE